MGIGLKVFPTITVLIVIISLVGFGVAYAVLETTIDGNLNVIGNLDIGGTLTGGADCNSALAKFTFVPDYRLPAECEPGTVPATLIFPGTGVSCTGDNCFSVLTDTRRFVTGELENTDPSWIRPNDCSNTGSGNYFYDEWVLLVDVAGDYKLTVRAEPDDYTDEDAVFDAFLFVYSPTFTPGTPLSNCLNVNDDDGTGASFETDSELTVALTTDSRVVVTSFTANDVGKYHLIAERIS